LLTATNEVVAESTPFAVTSISSITVDGSNCESDQPITLEFSNLSGNAQDWVDIAPVGSALSSYTSYVYAPSANGEVALPAPTAGMYVARAFYDNQDVLLAESAPFAVSAPGAGVGPCMSATVTTDASTYAITSTPVTITYAGLLGNPGDWLTVVRQGAAPSEYGDYVYTPQSAGSAPLSVPKSGVYVARAFAANGPMLVESAPFAVTSSSIVSTDASAYPLGAEIVVNFSMLSGSPTDWIDLAPATSPLSSWLTYAYATSANGSVTFAAPGVGNYVARAFWKNTFVELGESASFSVGDIGEGGAAGSSGAGGGGAAGSSGAGGSGGAAGSSTGGAGQGGTAGAAGSAGMSGAGGAVVMGAPHSLGDGRHPLATGAQTTAAAFQDESTFALEVSVFGMHGEPLGWWPSVSTASDDIQGANPVVAAVADGTYVLAWTDFDGDGDESGVAMRLFDPATGPIGNISHANVTTSFSQYDPDVLALADGTLVVAWTDGSDALNGPDVRLRRFSSTLDPLGGESTLANTPDVESDVVLGAFAGSWAAAWRVASNGMESLGATMAGGVSWTVGPFVSAPVDDRPALVALDATHLLLVHTEGVDVDGDGLADGSKLSYVVLDTATPGTTASHDFPADSSGLASGVWSSHPAAVRSGSDIYVAWRSAAVPGSARGEDLWLGKLAIDTSQWTVSIPTANPEIPLPRSTSHNLGDQRHPALASGTWCSESSLVAVWEDEGLTLGAAEGAPDVLFEQLPEPILRLDGGM
jgi:hypothetical protein